jgi:hypothetical protein
LAFLLFDLFPVAQNLGSVLGALVAEDVRVAANQFFVDFADDVVDGEAAFLVGDLRVEENLKEEVAEFLGEFGVVRGVEGVEDFIGFFDEIRAESRVGLLAVPRAAVGCAETGHDGDEFFEGGTDRGRGGCGV